jgi:hypothetical protein
LDLRAMIAEKVLVIERSRTSDRLFISFLAVSIGECLHRDCAPKRYRRLLGSGKALPFGRFMVSTTARRVALRKAPSIGENIERRWMGLT